jgi:hypothetical protein
MTKEIPTNLLACLNQKFTILDHFSFLDVDFDLDLLRDRLTSCYKDSYGSDERILIEHMDTDYYFKECAVGINLRNFFIMVRELGISYSAFIFYTNHIGLEKEVDMICSDADAVDRPFIIESFLSVLHHDHEKIKNLECNFDQIRYHAICMMHLTRSHRHAVCRAIRPIDRSRLILSATLPSNNASI